MKVLYHPNEVTTRVAKLLGLPLVEVNNVTASRTTELDRCDGFVLVCPAVGNREIPHPFESFLKWLVLKDKKYLICELGNRLGFEESFGAVEIIRQSVQQVGWKEIGPPLSLDVVPEVDLAALKKWKQEVLDDVTRSD